MNPRLICYDCDGTRRRLDAMGATPDPCETCDGSGVRRCEDCGDEATEVVDNGPACSVCAAKYEREAA